MFIGQITAIGLEIDIPFTIKSMASMLFRPKAEFLSFDVISIILTGIDWESKDNVLTNLVEMYSFNWWDGCTVGFAIL